MTVEQCTVDVMHLTLQQSDAIVKLLRYSHGLVAGKTMGEMEGRVMGAYFGDIRVTASTEAIIIVTSPFRIWCLDWSMELVDKATES